MACSIIKTDGDTAIICGPTRIHPCFYCGEIATIRCDAQVGKKKTCKRWTCRECALSVGPNKDFCRGHASTRETQLQLV